MLNLVGHCVCVPSGKGKGSSSIVLQPDISFSLDANERIAITGPSGCGKSTLLRQIAYAAGGEDDGSEPSSISVNASSVHFLPQSDFLFPWYSALDNFCYWLGRDLDKESADFEVAKALLLEKHITKRYEQLSGGQRQRVALWIALCSDAKLLLLDEPFTALDISTKMICLNLLSNWLDSRSRSLLLASHDFDILTYLSDKVIILPRDENGDIEVLEFKPPRHETLLGYRERRDRGDFSVLWKTLLPTF